MVNGLGLSGTGHWYWERSGRASRNWLLLFFILLARLSLFYKLTVCIKAVVYGGTGYCYSLHLRYVTLRYVLRYWQVATGSSWELHIGSLPRPIVLYHLPYLVPNLPPIQQNIISMTKHWRSNQIKSGIRQWERQLESVVPTADSADLATYRLSFPFLYGNW